jgi:hypothetical protein
MAIARSDRLDGRDYLGMAQRLDIAVALELLLVIVHRARNIDGEDQLEVDRDLGCSGHGKGKHRAERERGKTSAVHATTSAPARAIPPDSMMVARRRRRSNRQLRVLATSERYRSRPRSRSSRDRHCPQAARALGAVATVAETPARR